MKLSLLLAAVVPLTSAMHIPGFSDDAVLALQGGNNPPRVASCSIFCIGLKSDAGESRRTPEELRALFLNFHKFLTTLHYDEAYLKTPPPGGWPQFTPESCAHFKSGYAIEVLHHLPYFDSKCTAYIHFKSRLLDFTAFNIQNFEKQKTYHEGLEFWSDEGQVNSSDVICIAVGGESFARQLWLNINDCEIHEDMIAGDMLAAV
ncbi:hypothetical protein NM208_g332 [Fusarium decemcellulare]|uniref:Uncharacterized protein n=1 Tax=Fusarium decemcellulare TaxID=57161 RepID=A0ACC1SZZ9_9HYPO|nr:hypothetical protein NM208_g332 [Fusarium decemcellulare]